MSKLIYICARRGKSLPFTGNDAEHILSRLTPDNIIPRQPMIIEDQGILIGISNPVPSLPVEGTSVCLGAFLDDAENWWQPGTRLPDGSYALFRADEETLELATDIVASRTIWYVQRDDFFIASTSQRAIVCFLQSYESNSAPIPWMLSSGTLGPGFSWDRRIQCLGGDARLLLNRSSWKMEITKNPFVYAPLQLPPQEHEDHLLAAMEQTFEHIDAPAQNWLLPLSGGYDSRGILFLLKNRQGLKTMTWGLSSALDNRDSDAWVAQELARRMGVEHRYLETDLADESIEQIFNRFLCAGEGRVDHVAGYMDGFAIWKGLHEEGYNGILRGDEAFGCKAVTNAREVYRNMSLTTLWDYRHDGRIEDLGSDFGNQKRPTGLGKRNMESLEQWRDRVNAQFEIPFIFAALSDLKLSYVEIIQPLLSRRIVEQVRTIPDALRTDKTLYRRIIQNMEPKMKFAKDRAIGSYSGVLREKRVIDFLYGKLKGLTNQPGYMGPLSSLCLNQLENEHKSYNRLRRSRFYKRVYRFAHKFTGRENDLLPAIDPFNFAFRVYLISEMKNILDDDGSCLEQSP